MSFIRADLSLPEMVMKVHKLLFLLVFSLLLLSVMNKLLFCLLVRVCIIYALLYVSHVARTCM